MHRTYENYFTLDIVRKYGVALYYCSIMLHRQIEVNPITPWQNLYCFFTQVMGKIIIAVLIGKITVLIDNL